MENGCRKEKEKEKEAMVCTCKKGKHERFFVVDEPMVMETTS